MLFRGRNFTYDRIAYAAATNSFQRLSWTLLRLVYSVNGYFMYDGPIAACRSSRLQPRATSEGYKIDTFMSFSRDFRLTSLTNDSVGLRQHVRRNRETNLLGGFEIDYQLELRRLLDGKFGRLSAF